MVVGVLAVDTMNFIRRFGMGGRRADGVTGRMRIGGTDADTLVPFMEVGVVGEIMVVGAMLVWDRVARLMGRNVCGRFM